MHRRAEFRASKIMQDCATGKDNIRFLTPYVVDEVLGDEGFVSKLRVRNVETDEINEGAGRRAVRGHRAHPTRRSSWTGSTTTRTATSSRRPARRHQHPGRVRAGDVQDHVYRQAVTAAGTGLHGRARRRALAGPRQGPGGRGAGRVGRGALALSALSLAVDGPFSLAQSIAFAGRFAPVDAAPADPDRLRLALVDDGGEAVAFSAVQRGQGLLEVAYVSHPLDPTRSWRTCGACSARTWTPPAGPRSARPTPSSAGCRSASPAAGRSASGRRGRPRSGPSSASARRCARRPGSRAR